MLYTHRIACRHAPDHSKKSNVEEKKELRDTASGSPAASFFCAPLALDSSLFDQSLSVARYAFSCRIFATANSGLDDALMSLIQRSSC